MDSITISGYTSLISSLRQCPSMVKVGKCVQDIKLQIGWKVEKVTRDLAQSVLPVSLPLMTLPVLLSLPLPPPSGGQPLMLTSGVVANQHLCACKPDQSSFLSCYGWHVLLISTVSSSISWIPKSAYTNRIFLMHSDHC